MLRYSTAEIKQFGSIINGYIQFFKVLIIILIAAFGILGESSSALYYNIPAVLVIAFFSVIFFGTIFPAFIVSYSSTIATSCIRTAIFFSKPFKKLFDEFKSKYSKEVSEIIEEEEDRAIEDIAEFEERKIVKNISDLSEVSAKSIMTKASDVISVSLEFDFAQVLKVVKESGFSRIIVQDGDFQNISGVLFVKDLLMYKGMPSNYEWKTHIKPISYIDENSKADNLLFQFRDNKIHLAVVKSENGQNVGILSMEDILEEVVGEINDETD